MADLNQIVLAGRMVRDPQFYTTANSVIAHITVAANRRFTDKTGKEREESAFVPVTIFGKPAQWLKEHKKGETLLVSGRLKTESWDQNGTTQSKLVLVADHIQFFQRGSATAPGKAAGEAPEQSDIPF